MKKDSIQITSRKMEFTFSSNFFFTFSSYNVYYQARKGLWRWLPTLLEDKCEYC